MSEVERGQVLSVVVVDLRIRKEAQNYINFSNRTQGVNFFLLSGY